MADVTMWNRLIILPTSLHPFKNKSTNAVHRYTDVIMTIDHNWHLMNVHNMQDKKMICMSVADHSLQYYWNRMY